MELQNVVRRVLFPLIIIETRLECDCGSPKANRRDCKEFRKTVSSKAPLHVHRSNILFFYIKSLAQQCKETIFFVLTKELINIQFNPLRTGESIKQNLHTIDLKGTYRRSLKKSQCLTLLFRSFGLLFFTMLIQLIDVCRNLFMHSSLEVPPGLVEFFSWLSQLSD